MKRSLDSNRLESPFSLGAFVSIAITLSYGLCVLLLAFGPGRTLLPQTVPLSLILLTHLPVTLIANPALMIFLSFRKRHTLAGIGRYILGCLAVAGIAFATVIGLFSLYFLFLF